MIIIAAVVAGEATLVLLITLIQEIIFDGISSESPFAELFLGGLGTFLSAVAAGIVAYLIVGKKTVTPHIIISILVFIESTYLIFIRGSSDPLWFDLLAALSLLIGIWTIVIYSNRRKNVEQL
ncbi:MAG: hypothetical protein KJO77_01415 [Bacteroidia bacterium]|nr:hypothetical protein [Bacteroidia bacterium]